MAFARLIFGGPFDGGAAFQVNGYHADGEYLDHNSPDIHVLKAASGVQSVDVFSRVLMVDDDGKAFPLTDSSARLSLGVTSAILGVQFSVLPSHDVVVGSQSGVINIGGACQIPNFLAIVRADVGSTSHYARARVYVHASNAVVSLKLSPSPLHVRARSRAKLSLLANIGGVPANLTHDPDVQWSLSAGQSLEWRVGGARGGTPSAISGAQQIPSGFFFLPSGTAGGAQSEISATVR